MKHCTLTPSTQIQAKDYCLKLGTKQSDVAIFSKSTGEVCQFKNIRYKGKLATIKRMFTHRLCSGDSFYFANMTEVETRKMIEILKTK